MTIQTQDIAAIAAGLTKSQKRVVMSLPIDGIFGRAVDARCARRMWWGIGKGQEIRLIEHQHMTDNSWCLNRGGLAVRAHLQREASS